MTANSSVRFAQRSAAYRGVTLDNRRTNPVGPTMVFALRALVDRLATGEPVKAVVCDSADLDFCPACYDMTRAANT
jgi:enoyl-CoA hydratase/carnithine racemase